MNTDTVTKGNATLALRVRMGDLRGLQGFGLARLSNESKYNKHMKKRAKEDRPGGRPGRGRKTRPSTYRQMSGLDINNRDEQILDMREALKTRGGKYLFSVQEKSTSGWKKRRMLDANGEVIFRVVRPKLEEALRILRSGVSPEGERVDFMIVPNLDRLTRDLRTLEDIIDIVAHCGRPIIDPYGTLDLMTEPGRDAARAIIQHKQSQSADASRRVKRKATAMQREGIPAGGTRPFGWRKDKRRLHPVEAALLQKAVDDVFDGVTLHGICADWNRRGLVTVRGKKWQKETLKAMLRNPRMCGYRAITVQDPDASEGTRSRHMVTLYETQKVRDPETGKRKRVRVEVMGQWEPMITPERWKALLLIIGDKPGRGDGSNTRSYLGTGTLRCHNGECECSLRAQKCPPSAHKAPGHYWYTCRSKGAGGCGGIKIDGPKADAYLIELVFAKHAQQQQAHGAVAPIPAQWDGQPKLDRALEDMAALRKARDKGLITSDRYYQDLGDYEAKIAKLRQEQAKVAQSNQARALLPFNLPEIWDFLDLTEQRAIVEKVLSAVSVAPGHRGKPTPVHDRCTPHYMHGLAD